jgi:uncharacterized protein YggL (DUF469 family)
MSAACPTFGFTVDVQFAPGVTEADRQALWKSFVRLIDERGLTATEPMKRRWQCIVQSEASQAADADRQAVHTWAGARHEIVGVAIGQLVDLSAAE